MAELAWCKYCREYYGEGGKGKGTLAASNAGQAQLCNIDAYVKGTQNVKKDTASDHEKSKNHAKAVKECLPSKEVPVIYKHLAKMDENTYARMCKMFRWAYTVAHSELSFTDFPILISVEKVHGVDLGETYANDKACRTFIGEIGGTMSDDLKSRFQQKPFYCALLFDGSADKTLTEKEIISVKFLEEGVPKIKLLG